MCRCILSGGNGGEDVAKAHNKGPSTGHNLNATVHFHIIADSVHEHDSSR